MFPCHCKTAFTLSVLLFLGLFASRLPAQNIVSNGSFENGAFADNTGENFDRLPIGNTDITGWQVFNRELAWGQATNPYSLTASEGARFLDLTSYINTAPYAGVEQTLTTTAGTLYHVSLDVGTQQGTAGLAGPVSVQVSAGSVSQTFLSNPAGVGDQWETVGFDFAATSPNTLFRLVGLSGDNYIGIDNVAVIAVQAAPVPEPGSLVLLLALSVPAVGFLVHRHGSREAVES